MSSRKRPLTEISQNYATPSRYAPSTPHAVRALQERSNAKTRSARSTRQTAVERVHPTSIRGVLRRFAKLSAPVSQRRVVTPNSVSADKENYIPDTEIDDENDSVLLKKPSLTFAIEDSIDEDDSELPVAPTPSVLPEDDDDDQPTTTFQNVANIALKRPTSERSARRTSRMSLLNSEPIQTEDRAEHDVEDTIMTERGRRAISEEATGRLSRYSFGSIRMSDFGTELEIRRDSANQKRYSNPYVDEFVPLAGDDLIDGDETRDLRIPHPSPSVDIEADFEQLSDADNETFRLDMPAVDEDAATAHETRSNAFRNGGSLFVSPVSQHGAHNSDHAPGAVDYSPTGPQLRQETQLEMATSTTHASRKKRLKLTRHGTTVPSLPSSVIKRVVLDSYEKQSKRKPKLGRDHLKALEQATEWFFEQVGDDLASYSTHGRRRKRVTSDDVLLLMRRQKVLTENRDLPRLAEDWLPRDVWLGLDLPENL